MVLFTGWFDFERFKSAGIKNISINCINSVENKITIDFLDDTPQFSINIPAKEDYWDFTEKYIFERMKKLKVEERKNKLNQIYNLH